MEALTKAIDAAGGVSALARSIGVTQSAVSNWRARESVPPEHCAGVEAAAGAAVRRWHLRPNDWHRIWPELVGAPGAPAVAQEQAAA